MLTTLIIAAWLALVCGVIPVLAWISKRKIDQGLRIPRLAIYAEAMILQIVLLAISIGVAWFLGIRLFVPTLPSGPDLLMAAAVLGVALSTMILGWRFAGEQARERIRMLLPVTGRERLIWIALSAAAAVSEEALYRGLLPRLVESISGSFLLAIAISVVAFSLAHLLQGWTSALVVGIFALAFHGLVASSGGLWTAIAVHFIYDVLAGLTLGRVIESPETIHAEV